MLLGELQIGVGDINTKLGSIDDKMGATMGGFAKLGAAAAVVTASIAALAGVAAGLVAVLDLGGTLADLSSSTGESAGELLILRQAFDNCGLGAEGAGDFILKLQDNIAGVNAESGAAKAALDKMGISADSLRTQSALTQIETLQEGFAKLDQTSKVAAARDIFGKSGGAALALMNDPNAIGQAKDQAGPLAKTMEVNMAAFDALGDALNGVKLSVTEFFAGLLEPLAPLFTAMSEGISSLDFTGLGRGIGRLIEWILKPAQILFALGSGLYDFLTSSTIVTTGLRVIGGIIGGIGELLQKAMLSIAGMIDKWTGSNLTERWSKSINPGEEKGSSALAKLGAGDTTKSAESQISALQRVGGGGGFGGGDPMLTESQRQTSLLQRIADKLPGGSGSSNYIPVPV